MPNTLTRRTSQPFEEPRLSPAAPLARTVKAKTAAQERAERKLLDERLSWDVSKMIAEQAAAPALNIEAPKTREWGTLLQALNKHAIGSWIQLDKALAPFCMGATGPMNPKTGQYLTELRITGSRSGQVERALDGIETLLPFLNPQRGTYEFPIKCHKAKKSDKNWLSLKKAGKALVLSSVHPASSFNDLRSALVFISEHRSAAELPQL
jgi:hypothetical protein